MVSRPDGKGCGKPMGHSGSLQCYCGMIGVPLCDKCKPKKLTLTNDGWKVERG